jgi:hypothetical protein
VKLLLRMTVGDEDEPGNYHFANPPVAPVVALREGEQRARLKTD